VPSFYDFATVCQSLSQTQSRLQMAEEVGTFLASLNIDEAEIAARFMVGRAVEQGEEKRLQISGRAVWKIVAEMTDSADQGEDIFTAAEDFGEAIEMTLKLRAADPEPTLTIRELNQKFAEIAAIEGRHARNRKLDALRDLFARASAFEGKYIAKILIGEMRHGVSEGLMLEAIARMGARPVTEVRRIHMLEADLGRVVRIIRLLARKNPPPESLRRPRQPPNRSSRCLRFRSQTSRKRSRRLARSYRSSTSSTARGCRFIMRAMATCEFSRAG
jgi:DNA ligase-1